MWNDLRYAFRTLFRTPVFSVVAVAMLALGIAANTAIFSLFYQVLLRSLPVPAPEQLVLLHSGPPGLPGWTSSDNSETVFSYPMYQSLCSGAKQFTGLAARSSAAVEVSLASGSDRISAEIVSGSLFQVLGLRPRIGRLLLPEDDRVRDGSAFAVLSYPYWVEHFGASPSALNQKILVNGHPFVIIGVAPASFNGFMMTNNPDIYVPIAMKRVISPGWDGFDSPGTHWLNILGRVKKGVSLPQAEASLRPLWAATLRQHATRIGVKNAAARQRLLAKTLDLHSASKGINGADSAWRKPLTALLGMVALLLLIACANVASLLVARAVARNRELAIRVAIGADRWRIVRQTLAESLVLAAAGGVLGTAFSFALVRSLIAVLPEDVSGHWLTTNPDPIVLGFSLLLVAVTTLLFGVLPSIQVARIDPMPALKDQSAAASAGATHARWRQTLVAGQLAVSLALLVGAGLFAKTLLNLLSHDPGFRPEHLLTFSLDPQLSGYSVERGRNLYRALEQRLQHLPGVNSASLAASSPLSNSESSTNVTVEGFTPREDEDANSDTNKASAGFFRTMGTQLLAGREFTEQDREGAPSVAVVNEAFVKHFLHGQNPLGKRMKVGGGNDPLNIEIVGVVKDADNLSLRETVKPMYYLPFEQSFSPKTKTLSLASFFMRTQRDPSAVERSIRAVVRELDPNLPVLDVKSMTERVNASIYTDRLSALLAIAFGVLATLLAAVGLYGVVAYSVARRTVEIGIRLALGAVPAQVLRLVMREVMLLAAIGALIGIPLAYALARIVGSQLYGISAGSLEVFCAATAVIVISAAVAGFVPAFRATTVDPKQALRYE